MTVRVSINGAGRELAAGTTVADVVAELAPPPSDNDSGPRETPARGIAVAVNDEVVPRTAWPHTLLAEADRIEVLTAVQGG